jgi:hypothetical protein
VDAQAASHARPAATVSLLVLMAALLCGEARAGGAPTVTEYSVKAAYLSKFGAFVDWPPNAFNSPNSPIVICVAGEDPFGPVLDQTVGGQRIGSRPIEVKRLERVERNQGCQILYLGSSRRQSAAEALKAVRGAPVLTVTDGKRNGPPGIIQFAVTGNHVRFSIDPEAAARCGLTISSKLLSVAMSVRNRP